MPAQGDPTVVAINPEGTLIAIGSTDGRVFVWCLLSYGTAERSADTMSFDLSLLDDSRSCQGQA